MSTLTPPSARPCRPGWLAVCLLLLGAALPAPAADEAEVNARMRQLRERIERLRQEVAETRDQHDRARNALRDVELRIGRHVRELKYIHFRLGQQDRRLGQLYHDRQRYQREVVEQRELLARQLRASYIMGRQAYLKLLLSQDDPAATGRTLRYYDYFHRSRTELIQRAETAVARYEQNRQDIEREKGRLQELRDHNLKTKTQLETDSAQRRQMLASLNQQLQGKTTSLSRLLEDERQLQRLLEGIEKAMPDDLNINNKQQAFASLKGRLAWPASGRVQRLFGSKRGGSAASWNGIVIQSKEGTEVHAVSHGRVAYADWLRGYGLLLIIDHGDGYMSLYGHNQSLFKETGDWVEAGEAIATIGNSGGHTQSGLYFEIRHKGKPINPVNWCRPARRA